VSEARDALEQAQARLRDLAREGVTDAQLQRLADSLDQECEALETLLVRAEGRDRGKESSGLAARLLTTGFTLLFGMPTVVMISASASRMLRFERELAVVVMLAGAALISGVFSTRVSVAVARWFSDDWRWVRKGRRLAGRVRAS
jgi:hypothetical protein